MKQMKHIVVKCLLGAGLLLTGQIALANCPNGQFNPYQQVCICPGGGNVAPGQRCPEGGGGGGVVVLPPPKTWGAIAIDMSKEQEKWGFATSESSQAEANRKALALCKLSSCRVAVTFRNSCGAITKNRNGIWGGGVSTNEDKAMQLAADACYAKGAKDCYKWVPPKCAAAPR